MSTNFALLSLALLSLLCSLLCSLLNLTSLIAEMLSSVEANKKKTNVFLNNVGASDEGVVKGTFWNLKLEKSHSSQFEEEGTMATKFLSYEEKERRREMEEIARSRNRVDWGEWARSMEDEESEDGDGEEGGERQLEEEWQLARKYMLLDPHVAKANVSMTPDGSLDFYEEEFGDDGEANPSVRDFLRFALDDPTASIRSLGL